MSSFTRRTFLSASAGGLAASALAMRSVHAAPSAVAGPTVEDAFALRKAGKKIPVVFDTDIGGDIDDTWALLMLLNSPELDVKLVVSDYKNGTYRAKVLAKMLEVCGRTDIPVGIGLDKGDRGEDQADWVADYDLGKYPGRVYEDGADAIIQTIRQSKDPVTLIAVGPVPNLPEVLRRAPDVAEKARFVGMHGSVRKGYGGSEEISAEWNVRADPAALRAVFKARWEKTVTPLDTCGIVHLAGPRYARIHGCQTPGAKALMENYRVWTEAQEKRGNKMPDPAQRSSTLFDTVAAYLGYSEDLLEMETIKLVVTDNGFTRIDDGGSPVRCAMAWKDLDAFEEHLTERIVRSG
ncbi:MAG: nucleoside hydrolase [Planctomycetaceae bacterium]|nr:nucleoside hydrolase [Planctomycetaceae bacterium]